MALGVAASWLNPPKPHSQRLQILVLPTLSRSPMCRSASAAAAVPACAYQTRPFPKVRWPRASSHPLFVAAQRRVVLQHADGVRISPCFTQAFPPRKTERFFGGMHHPSSDKQHFRFALLRAPKPRRTRSSISTVSIPPEFPPSRFRAFCLRAGPQDFRMCFSISCSFVHLICRTAFTFTSPA